GPAVGEVDAGPAVAQGDRAGNVGPDGVALDQVPGGHSGPRVEGGPGEDAGGHVDAVDLVARDEIAGPGRRPPDGVVGGAQIDAVALVAQGPGARDVRAYVVALDHVAGRVISEDVHPAHRVARDD